jgi:CheY-like chemotaxis protein
MTILVADDNLAGRELMGELLEALGTAWSKRQTDVKPLTSSIEIRPMLGSWICKCRFSTVSVWSANCEAPSVSAAWPIWGT